MTPRQHKLRRIWKRKYDADNCMGRDAGKDMRRVTQLTSTGKTCTALKAEGWPTIYANSKGGHIQFWGKTFEPF
jgi:hypothetical protein